MTPSAARDYERIARAIAYLQHHAGAQPDLAAVARAVHLSEHHFQRLFTRWAGVSPKRFLQFLTVSDARRRIADAANISGLASDVGLSGSGRLHDLFVAMEAISPGEARLGGAGLDIRYGVHKTRFGPALIATTTRGICALRFVHSDDDGNGLLAAEWPRARILHDPRSTATVARSVFTPLETGSRRPLALLVKGTNFQVKVWQALLTLPAGMVTTYGRLAESLGVPSSARAIGSAVGANPIAYLIPCHRVIRASGALTGYRWGTERKAAILAWEAAQGSIERQL